VTSIAVAGGRRFTPHVALLPFDIEPGGARQIDVVYEPINAGTDSDMIVVASDGIASPGVATVALLGNARGPPSGYRRHAARSTSGRAPWGSIRRARC